jgi:hypothetical protein
MAVASIWAVIAAPLAANEVISVVAELASYWLAFFVVSGGGWLNLKSLNQSVAPLNLFYRRIGVIIAMTVVMVSWHLSDRQFAFWKIRSISSNAWSKMASDLREMGEQAGESGTNFLSSRTPMPPSLRQLGLSDDFSGGMGNVWKTPEYTGPVAAVLFGYRNRSWGLCVGPESFANRYSRMDKHILVASNAYFFYGPRD